MNTWKTKPSTESSRWLSRQLTDLLSDKKKCGDDPGKTEASFDVLIVGTGYGGSIAADYFSGMQDDKQNKTKVCVLERGREYLPGSFPSSAADLPNQIRGSVAGRVRDGQGLFDIRIGADVSVVLANGLGGGSLINAGVMEIPDASVFKNGWPKAELNYELLLDYYNEAKTLLGATVDTNDNTIETHSKIKAAGRKLDKTKILSLLAENTLPKDSAKFRAAAITVAMQDKTTIGGVKLSTCNLCGDCATGCNYSAKESLDTNLLARAVSKGAEIYCGATVLKIKRLPDDRWAVQVTHTDPAIRRRESGPRWITTRKLILAAGSLGSTEILLRSTRDAEALSFSSMLGHRFSTNGDLVTFGYGYGFGDAGIHQDTAVAIADEDSPATKRMIGPTITGVVETFCEAPDNPRLVIEEMAVPGPLGRLIEEALTTSNLIYSLGQRDKSVTCPAFSDQ